MAARLLDGIAVAQAIRADMRPRVDAFAARAGRPPAIALVLVGNDGGSELYVASKLKSAGESGIRAALTRLPETASIEALLDATDGLVIVDEAARVVAIEHGTERCSLTLETLGRTP